MRDKKALIAARTAMFLVVAATAAGVTSALAVVGEVPFASWASDQGESAKPAQTMHVPGREIIGSYTEGADKHKIMIVNGGWGIVDLISYRSFELVPVKDGEQWQVDIFSDGKRITSTSLFASEQSAITEAKKIADGIGSP